MVTQKKGSQLMTTFSFRFLNKLNKTLKISIMAVSALALVACETTPVIQETTVWDDPLWQKHYRSLKPIKQFSLKGRIGITNPQDSFSSNFRWQQQAFETFKFRMYGALGQTYLILNANPTLARLDTGDDKHFEGNNAAQLIEQASGMRVPVNYLSDWIKGLPTGVNQDQLIINADGTLRELKFVDNQSLYPYRVLFERYKKFKNNEALEKPMPTKIRILNGDTKIILSIRNWQF